MEPILSNTSAATHFENGVSSNAACHTWWHLLAGRQTARLGDGVDNGAHHHLRRTAVAALT